MKTESSTCQFTNGDSWVILSPIEQSIKNKIEKVGTPLKDWDINIYRGVLTGCNEAFIISTDKRNEILANCKTAEERKKTEELIRPILRGRDIKRYSYEWADRWVICARVCENIPQNFPAVAEHLAHYKGKGKLGDNSTVTVFHRPWWSWMQEPINYWEDFFKPKICWKAVGRMLTFSIVESGTFLTAPASFIQAGNLNEYILAILCSNMGTYFIYQNSDTTGAGDIMLNIQSLVKFSIPKYTNCTLQQQIVDLVTLRLQNENAELEDHINKTIYQLYNLTSEEIKYVENSI